MSILDSAPTCGNCNGTGDIRCLALPPLQCPECLGTGKDLRAWHDARREKSTRTPKEKP